MAFKALKNALAKATILYHPIPNAETCLSVDASDYGGGTVLSQRSANVWHPLAFFSKSFSPPQLKYSAFDRKLLAAKLAVKHFRDYLSGTSVVPHFGSKLITNKSLPFLPLLINILKCRQDHLILSVNTPPIFVI